MSNLDQLKVTKVGVRDDEAATVTSRQHGHNLDVIAFNLSFLDAHDKALALSVMRLYEQAKALEATVPGTPAFAAACPHDPTQFDD